MDKPLAKLSKRKREAQINKIVDEKGSIRTDAGTMQGIIKIYFRNNILELENLKNGYIS